MAHALRPLIRQSRVGTALVALLFVFAFASQAARAQSTAPEQTVRFTVLSARPAAGLTYVARARQAAAPVVLYPTARSPRYEYRGPMPIRILDAKTTTAVAEASVPPTITEALLILVPIEPVPATGLRYQVYVLDDTAARQAPGTLAIINFSGLALAGTIEGKPATLQTGLNPAQAVGRTAAIMLRTVARNRNVQAYAGSLELAKHERALLLLLPPFYKGSSEVQSRMLVDSPGGAKTGR
jgi:hypothetical protein